MEADRKALRKAADLSAQEVYIFCLHDFVARNFVLTTRMIVFCVCQDAPIFCDVNLFFIVKNTFF